MVFHKYICSKRYLVYQNLDLHNLTHTFLKHTYEQVKTSHLNRCLLSCPVADWFKAVLIQINASEIA